MIMEYSKIILQVIEEGKKEKVIRQEINPYILHQKNPVKRSEVKIGNTIDQNIQFSMDGQGRVLIERRAKTSCNLGGGSYEEKKD